MSERPTSPGAGIRAYRRLLGLLPADMRERFGGEMEEVLRLRLVDAKGSALRSAAVWTRAVADLVFQAIAIRFEERGGNGMKLGPIAQDVRYAFRGIRRTPGMAVLVILTLGLGIGATTATFSVVHGVLLEGLPFDEPERLVVVWPEVNANKAMTLLAGERMSTLQSVAGVSGWGLTLTGAGEPREIDGLKVSANYFDLLGVRPELGRGFAPGEDLPGAAGVVVLSHRLWVGAFGADPTILDRTIELGGADYDRRRVIGVMPSGVDEFLQDVDAWIPLEGDPALGVGADDTWYVNTRVARLAPGATLERATAEVKAYAAEVQREIPDHFTPEDAQGATVREVREYLTRDVRASLWVAMGAVGLVLLIGCFNVANLLLARGDRRVADLAVRAALGARRGRIVRLLLTESATLGIAGGALGVAGAYGLLALILRQAPDDIPGIASVTVSAAALGFATVATLLSTFVAGLVPALRAARLGAIASLPGATRGAARPRTSRLTPALVGAQVALAVIVTIGSGLMIRSLTRMLAVDPGVDGREVMAFKPVPPAGRYPDGPSFREYYRQVGERVAALPFVESVGAIHLLPGTLQNWSFPTFPQGWVVEEGGTTPSVNFRAVRGDYFGVTRIPLLRGRLFEPGDRQDAEPVVVVNDAFVRAYWPGDDPLGKTLRIFSDTGTSYRVVGVVADVHQLGLDIEPLPEMYFSHAQVPWSQMSLWVVARLRPGTGRPERMAGPLREAVWSIDPDVPVNGMTVLSDALSSSARGTRFLTVLLSAFGGLALVLSAVGVFGVTAYSSGRRRGEFGVRLALGSTRGAILRAALARNLVPVMAGLVAGLLASYLASGLLSSALFGVSAGDPITFAGVTVVMTATALLAAGVPAWRASRLDAARILGSE